MIPPKLKISCPDTREWTADDAESVMMQALAEVRSMGFRVRDPGNGADVVEFWCTPIHPLQQLANCADEESTDD